VALGDSEANLYLIEVEDQVMLLGTAADRLQVLWQAPPEVTSSFAPVPSDEQPEEPEPLVPVLLQAQSPWGFGPPTRGETDWARQRSQLISALIQPE
jgi:flagellar biogenesis protein FliO